MNSTAYDPTTNCLHSWKDVVNPDSVTAIIPGLTVMRPLENE